ncbi:MAG: response regulator [Bacteroidetes bacterium]|nr:response regulator [Bacteroidota bacterium]MCB0844358.1 response regulator [Bacteroidota bacterium]
MNAISSAEILFADDNHSDLDLVKFALEEKEITKKLFCVLDGVEALDFLLCQGKYIDRQYESLPGLVVLDLNLPKVSGLEVLDRLRENPRTKDIPVVIFSSSVDPDDVSRSYSRGANGFIVKPADFFEFSDVIAGIIRFWLPD